MVTWTNLCAAIAKNNDRGFCVAAGDLVAEGRIDLFRLPVVKKEHKIVLPVEVVPVQEEDNEDLPPPPPPTKFVGAPAIVVAAAAAPTPVAAVPPLVTQPKPKVPEQKRSLPIVTKQTLDPIVLAIERTEPLYVGAPYNNKHAIEVAEAVAIEAKLAELYKSESGRSRGWTKTALDLWIKPRCASGGNLKELDKAKAGFAWQLLMDDKAQSSFLDFVCVAKHIRVAVWFEETKTVLVYPAADATTDIGVDLPLFHMSSTGHVCIGPDNGKELFEVCTKNNYTALPPLSVMGSLSGLKLDELENVGKQLGMATVEGKKVERIAAIASHKLRMRLLG
jgi:hypothetical protein